MVFLIGACGEASAQFSDEFATVLGTLDDGIVRCGNNTAQVAQVEFGQVFTRCFGTVKPIGDAQAGEKILSHLHNALLGHGWLAFSSQCSIGFFEALTNCLHSLQREFGNGTLIFGKLRQHSLAMC